MNAALNSTPDAMPDPMQPRRPMALSRMLGLGQFLAVGAALGVLCFTLLAYQFVSLRATLTDDVTVQAAIISESVAASLMFHDQDAAADMLHSFRPSPFLASATVLDRQGLPFASYRNAALKNLPAPLRGLDRFAPFAPVSVTHPVSYRGIALGHVVLRAHTQGIQAAMLRYGALLALASLGAMLATSLVTRRTKARMRRAEQELHYLAYTDPVTGLPNRRCTYEALEAEVAARGRDGGRFGLLLLDLDNFKIVNDTAGHAAGDRLLRQVASVLRATVRPSDHIGRIGGDEFAVIVSPLEELGDLERIAQRIIAGLRQPLQIEGQAVTATASIGVSTFPHDAPTMSELLSNADVALYRAKAKGRDNVAVFEPGMIQATQRRASLERDLRLHLEAGMLELAYQPQFACAGGALVGAEALLRWQHPQHGAISPVEFIPIAEECGLIVDLGKWVLERACLDAVALYRETGVSLSMAVNVSARQLRDRGFIEVVEATLARTGMRPELLDLELTESMLMEDIGVATDFMHKVRALGVRLSIDDFGTGYSSLAYLQTFPINHLKIDRSFVRQLPQSGTTIAGAVIGLAHGFNLTVVAEGVEEPAQLEWLRQAGCDYVQGYLLARPLPLAALREKVMSMPAAVSPYAGTSTINV
jgi:diguanylate cyclase (GGDEF)-like protein